MRRILKTLIRFSLIAISRHSPSPKGRRVSSLRTLLISSFSIFIFSVSPIFADATYTGVTSAQFLKVYGMARPAGMSGAMTALGDDLDGAFFNPSALAFIDDDNLKISTSYMTWLGDTKYTNFSFAKKLGIGTVALMTNFLYLGEFQESTDSATSGTGNTITSYDYSVGLGFGFDISDRYKVGIVSKVFSDVIGTNSLTGYSLDLGSNLQLNKNIYLGLSAKNVVGTFGAESLPFDYSVGLGLKSERLNIGLDYHLPRDAFQYLSVGGEFLPNNKLAFRAGFDTKQSGTLSPSFGIGLMDGNVSFDYSYRVQSNFEGVHSFSMKFSPIYRYMEERVDDYRPERRPPYPPPQPIHPPHPPHPPNPPY